MPKLKAGGLADLKTLRAEARKVQEQRAAQAQPQATSSVDPAELEEDRKRFLRAVVGARPVKGQSRVIHPSGVSVDNKEQRIRRRERATGDKPAVKDALSDVFRPLNKEGTRVSYAAPGVSPDAVRRLKRGDWPVGAQIDLHGMRTDEARLALSSFIQTSSEHQTRCVRIIHGKGYGSTDGDSVLRDMVGQWLPQIAVIQAFVSAPPAHGGTGATLALVRPS